MLWRGAEPSSSDTANHRNFATAVEAGDLFGDLVLELPIELLPLFERLRTMAPKTIQHVFKNAVRLADDANGLNEPAPALE